jgi:hypothetical protein
VKTQWCRPNITPYEEEYDKKWLTELGLLIINYNYYLSLLLSLQTDGCLCKMRDYSLQNKLKALSLIPPVVSFDIFPFCLEEFNYEGGNGWKATVTLMWTWCSIHSQILTL